MKHHAPIEFTTMASDKREFETNLPNESEETDFTERVLLSLAFDISCLSENVEQIKVKVYALCREKGVAVPKDDKTT